VIHGIAVDDPYRWLEDGTSSETRDWADAQNARTRAVLDALPQRADAHRRLSELLRAGSSGGPIIEGGLVFSLDRWGDLDQAVLCTRPLAGDGAAEPTVVLNLLADGTDDTAAIDWYRPSRDGRLVAYGTSLGGSERSTLRIVDVTTGEHLADEIPHTRAASVGWFPDGSGFAYTRYSSGGDYDRHVFVHRLGAEWADDAVLFADLPDPTAWPDVAVSRDGRLALVHVELGWSRTDVHLVDLATNERRVVIEGVEATTWLAFDVGRSRLVGHTTHAADRGRVVSVPIGDGDALGPEHWTTLVAESESVIEAVAIADSGLLVATGRRAVASLHRHDHDGAPISEVALPELGSITGLASVPGESTAVVGFTSFTRPSALWRLEAATSALTPLTALPGGPDPAAFALEQVTYKSLDGTPVAMFLLGPSAADSNADLPTLLNGYGGFAISESPAYSPLAAAWVEAGGRFAVACLRGGSEEGEAWHRAGMRENKQNVFDDFHAAADWLVSTGRTTRAHLAIRGGSNGGLLVAAATTQRPDLCQAVVCAVPLTDMVRFPRFLIARLWIPEYGDPDVAEELAWLHAYSPYHRVVDGTCYPAVLIETGEEDSRVDPAHARKLAARLQAATSCGDEHAILVRIEARAGHGQGKPAGRQAEEAADVLTFLRWQLDF
jgi:prolyl oligopeptidase